MKSTRISCGRVGWSVEHRERVHDDVVERAFDAVEQLREELAGRLELVGLQLVAFDVEVRGHVGTDREAA